MKKLFPVFLALLVACASVVPATIPVFIGKDSMTVLGQTVKSQAELVQIMKDNKVTSVELRPEPGVGYERIGMAIYGVTRGGATIEHVDKVKAD